MHAFRPPRLRHLTLVLVIAAAAVFSAPGRGRTTLAATVAPPAASCTLSGTTRTCELWARAGTVSLPGAASVPIWGYTDSASGAAQLPGPTITANQGETLTVILHNQLSEASSLMFSGQDLPPDTSGAAPGGDATYTFTADQPGTFLYEAGLTPNGARQVAMGMFGALIIRPSGSPNQAYNDAASAFDDEALLVINEIDPAFNANPSGFRMQNFAPKYELINGKAYPNTDPIATSPGHKLLVRYLNAGIMHHAVGLLGLHQTVLANDGIPLAHPSQVVAEEIAAGQSLDVIIAIPATAAPATKYALYDSGLTREGPGGPNSFGGMLTFVSVADAPPGADTVGPTTSGVQLAPAATNGTTDIALSATVSDAGSGGANVTAAEYFIDSPGAAGTGKPMTGTFGVPQVNVSATIPAADLAPLASGNHKVYVRGQDAAGNWGAVAFGVLTLDKAGPTIRDITATPNPTSSGAVALAATASDAATGNADLAAAEYFIDTVGADGSGQTMTLNQTAPTASLTATIPAATVAGLAEGTHTISVHARDAHGNWGPFGTATLTVDRAAPTASSASVTPNPNNGTLSVPNVTPAIRVDATFTDPTVGGSRSNIRAAEGFIETAGTTGTGFPFVARDGLFDNPSEAAYATVALSAIQGLAQGPHTIYVHGQDAAGNWGAMTTITLIIDKTGPTATGVVAAPNPTGGAASFALTATATDSANGAAPASNITAAEWFDGADPGVGQAQAMAAADGAFDSPSEGLRATINTNGLAPGSHTLSVRARDAAGNWGAVTTTSVTVQPPDALFADGFEAGNFSAWSATSGGTRISVSTAAALVGTRGMQATISGNTPGYVADTTPNNEASYHARFYFHPNGTGTGTSQHDIFVGRNAGGTTIFRVQYRRTGSAPNYTYQVRAGVARRGGTTYTSWFSIGNGPQVIEIAWQSRTSAAFTLYIGGTARQTLAGLNTSAYLLDAVRLGPSGGLTAAMSGTEYYDAFVSTRTTYIGP